MNDEQQAAFVAAVTAAVTAALDARPVTPEHLEHHEWVRVQIERQRARNEFWAGLAQKSLPAIVWSLIATGIGWLWHLATNHITWR